MRGRLVLILLLGLAPAMPSFSDELNIRHFRENDHNVTEGWIDASTWANQAKEVLFDYPNYRNWGVRWMDGKDPHSSTMWVHLTEYQYTAPDTMDLFFDLNMGWPFGSKGNRARFRINRTAEEKSSIHLILEQPPIGLDAASLLATIQEATDTQGARLYFRLEMKFWGIVEGLMDFKKFQNSMGWRISRMQENLKEYVASRP